MYIGGYAEQDYNFEAFLAFEEILKVEVGIQSLCDPYRTDSTNSSRCLKCARSET